MSSRKRAAARRTAPSPAVAAPARPLLARPIWITLGLVVLTLCVFGGVRTFQFVNWDDPLYITANPHVAGGLTWQNVAWAITRAYAPYWHPVTWMSHLLDVQLYGLNAGGHHLTSLLWHVANTVLVFFVLRRLTGSTERSAFVAAIFAVHPMHVESVAWVTERKDVLSTFFLMLTIRAYVAYVRRPGWPRYLTMLALFLLALMSKPMVVTLPVVLLLLDVWPLARLRGSALARVGEKLPLFAMSVATGIATVVFQRRVGAVPTLAALPWRLRLANGIVGYVAYLAKMSWPVHLAAFYPLERMPAWIVLSAAAFLVAATVAASRLRDRHPYVLVGWLWYLVTIAPVIGFVQAGEQAMADRFTYVPMIGILIIIAWGVPEIAERWRFPAPLVPAAAMAIVAICAFLARAQVATWADSATLWTHALEVTSHNYVAYEKRGDARRDDGQLTAAEADYGRALGDAPPNSPVFEAIIHNDLGLVATKLGRPREAVTEFEAAVHLNPGFAAAQNNDGNALAAAGRLAEAADHFRAAVHETPDVPDALIGLGNVLVQENLARDAIPNYRQALRLDPALAEAHDGLASALAMTGDEDHAAAEYNEALRLKPSATTHLNLAILLIKRGRLDEARRHLESALSMDPANAQARALLAQIAGRDGHST